jgi:hypothetical protein
MRTRLLGAVGGGGFHPTAGFRAYLPRCDLAARADGAQPRPAVERHDAFAVAAREPAAAAGVADFVDENPGHPERATVAAFRGEAVDHYLAERALGWAVLVARLPG